MLETQLVTAREKHSRRLMIVLHGLGDSMEGYRWLPPALGLSWLRTRMTPSPSWVQENCGKLRPSATAE